MYDIDIKTNQAWADYQAALQAFATVFKQICDHQIKVNEAVAETVELQKDILLNKSD